jgi:hypothetical protein
MLRTHGDRARGSSYGHWLRWLDHEFGWMAKSRNFRDLSVRISSLYRLAAHSTTAELRSEILDRLESGEHARSGLHSADPAHNLERIFYAILRLKTGRSEIRADRRLRTLQRSRAKQPRRRRATRTPRLERGVYNGSHSSVTCRSRGAKAARFAASDRVWPRPSESATMSSDCLRKKIKRRSASRVLRHAP